MIETIQSNIRSFYDKIKEKTTKKDLILLGIFLAVLAAGIVATGISLHNLSLSHMSIGDLWGHYDPHAVLLGSALKPVGYLSLLAGGGMLVSLALVNRIQKKKLWKKERLKEAIVPKNHIWTKLN